MRLEAKGCSYYKVRSMRVDPSYGELEAELENRRHHDPAKVDRMLTNLRKGLYGDFTSSLACPKTTLASDLKAAGFDDLAKRVYEGDFDF